MKKILFLASWAVAALMVTSPVVAGTERAGDNVALATTDKELPEGQSRVVIPVKGMTCGACASSIKRAVKKLDGVISVEVDHEGGTATVVRQDDMVTVRQIVEAINKTGFRAKEPAEG